MSARKEVIRIDAGMSNRLAKQARMRAARTSGQPKAKSWRKPVVAAALLGGCMSVALCVVGVCGASTGRPEHESGASESAALAGLPVAPAALSAPEGPAAVAAAALTPDSQPVVPVRVEVTAPQRAASARGKETHGSLFARLDANQDGAVSSAEYAVLVRNKQKHRGQILSLDKDRDGRITESEFSGIGLKMLLKWLDVQD